MKTTLSFNDDNFKKDDNKKIIDLNDFESDNEFDETKINNDIKNENKLMTNNRNKNDIHQKTVFKNSDNLTNQLQNNKNSSSLFNDIYSDDFKLNSESNISKIVHDDTKTKNIFYDLDKKKHKNISLVSPKDTDKLSNLNVSKKHCSFFCNEDSPRKDLEKKSLFIKNNKFTSQNTLLPTLINVKEIESNEINLNKNLQNENDIEFDSSDNSQNNSTNNLTNNISIKKKKNYNDDLNKDNISNFESNEKTINEKKLDFFYKGLTSKSLKDQNAISRANILEKVNETLEYVNQNQFSKNFTSNSNQNSNHELENETSSLESQNELLSQLSSRKKNIDTISDISSLINEKKLDKKDNNFSKKKKVFQQDKNHTDFIPFKKKKHEIKSKANIHLKNNSKTQTIKLLSKKKKDNKNGDWNAEQWSKLNFLINKKSFTKKDIFKTDELLNNLDCESKEDLEKRIEFLKFYFKIKKKNLLSEKEEID